MLDEPLVIEIVKSKKRICPNFIFVNKFLHLFGNFYRRENV